MVRRWGLVSITVVLAGCGSGAATLADGRISRDRAVTLAQARVVPMSEGAVTLIAAQQGPLRDFLGPGESMPNEQRQVWAVSFHGVFPPESCGPAPLPGHSPRPCPTPHSTAYVVLDAGNGAFLFIGTPATASLGGP